MIALDPRHVDHPRGTAQQDAARERRVRHRLPAAFGDRAGAIGDPLAARQQIRDHRVMLELLERQVGVHVGVLVPQMHDEPDIDLIVVQMIDERPAAGVAAQRPAHRVRHGACTVPGGVDLPQLLHPEPVFLWFVSLGKVVLGDHLLRQRSAHAFTQQDVFADQLHARLVGRPF